MDTQKKKGLKIYMVIVTLAALMGLVSLYLPQLTFLRNGSQDEEKVNWEELSLDYGTAEAAEWKGLAEEDYPAGEKGLLFHNNGQFMDCDLMETGGDCRLVGVYCFKFWDQIPVESYYFSNQPFADEGSLLAWILPEQYSRSTQLMGRGLDFQAKYLSFAFLDEEGGVQSSVTTRVQGEKMAENIRINGVPGGTKWLVWMDAEMESETLRGISGFSTLLDVKDEKQKLIRWEPVYSTAPKVTISFSTSDGISRTESYDELPLTVECSMSGDYGKWTYDIPKFPQRKLAMEPQVEVTNQDELLTMQLQHTAAVKTGVFRKEELDTGRIRIEFTE